MGHLYLLSAVWGETVTILTNKYELGDIVRNPANEDCEVMQVVVAYRLRPLTKPLPYSLVTPQDDLTLVQKKCRHIRQSDPDYEGKGFPYFYCPSCGEKL